jgi:hypothetical protein
MTENNIQEIFDKLYGIDDKNTDDVLIYMREAAIEKIRNDSIDCYKCGEKKKFSFLTSSFECENILCGDN